MGRFLVSFFVESFLGQSRTSVPTSTFFICAIPLIPCYGGGLS